MRLRNGTVLEKFIEHAVGSKDRPMSDADLEAKFHGLAEGILSKTETDALIRACWDISGLQDAAAVARAAVPANPHPLVA